MIEAVAKMGDNLPPNDAELLPQTLSEQYALMLGGAQRLVEAADRLPETIADEETAGKMADYIKKVSNSRKNLEGTRVAEKEPYLTLGRVVDGFFKKVTDELDGAKNKAQKRLDAWMKLKMEAERRRRIEEAAALQRQAEAEAAAAKALEDAKMAPQADKMLAQAQVTEAAAIKVEESVNERPAHMAQSRGDSGATASLRTRWIGEIDSVSALDLEKLRPFLNPESLQKAINLFVAAGGRELKGAVIYERSDVVVR